MAFRYSLRLSSNPIPRTLRQPAAIFRRKMAIQALPIIICGKREEIGQIVADELKPDYEVVRFVQSVEDGIADIPALLEGKQPTSGAHNTVETRNFSMVPVAVITGGGYDDESFEKMRAAADSKHAARKVPWLRPDMSKASFPPGPEYAKEVSQRARKSLEELKQAGQFERSDGELMWY